MDIPILHRIKLSTKLGLGFLLVLALLVTFLTIDNFYRAAVYERRQLAESHEKTVAAKAEAIEGMLYEPVAELLFLKSSVPVQAMVNQNMDHSKIGDYLQAFLQSELKRSAPHFGEIAILDERGEPLVTVTRGNMSVLKQEDPEGQRARYEAALFGANSSSSIRGWRAPVHIGVHQIRLGDTSDNTLHLIDYTVQLRDSNDTIHGVLILSIEANILLNKELQVLDVGDSAVIDARGEIISANPPAEIKTILASDALRNQVLSKKSGSQVDHVALPGKAIFYAPIHSTGQFGVRWALVSVLPTADLQVQVSRAQQSILLAGCVSLLVAALMVVLFTRRTVAPIQELANATRTVGPGNWQPNLPQPVGTDEVAELVQGFSIMTARLQEMHEQQERTAEHLRITLHSIGEGVIVTDTDGTVTSMNTAAQQLTCRDSAKAFGVHFGDILTLYHEHSKERANVQFRAVLEQQKTSLTLNDVILVCPDGEEHPVAVTVAAIEDTRKSVFGMVIVVRDQREQRAAARALERINTDLEARVQERTLELQKMNKELNTTNLELKSTGEQLMTEMQERKQAEDALVRSERMAAVGTLAAGVAHEFNNINVIVIGFIQMVLMESSLSEDVTDRLNRVLKAAKRAADITNKLVSFAGNNESQCSNAQLHIIVEQTLDLVEISLHKDNIEVVNEIKRVPYGYMDPSRIGQVVMNLLINAQHALLEREHKQIRISTSHTEAELIFEVEDNGCGMNRSEISRIFTPFFSTKGEHAKGETPQSKVRGTGLGLSVCLKIINDHNGQIHVDSEPDRGTSFRVHLPRHIAEESPEDEKIDGSSITLHAKGKRALVIDDEPDVIELARLSLSILGFEVEAFRDAQAALNRLTETDFDLVMIDMIMPRLTGRQFILDAGKMELLNPPAILVMTGCPLKQAREDLADVGRVDLIRKPFGQDELKIAIHNALRAQGRT